MAFKYVFIEKISEGQFGQVFKGQHVRTNDYVAIKLELANNSVKTLKNEAKIYNYLNRCDGFPKLKWYGVIDNYHYLVIDLLGDSLTKKIQHFKVFGLRTVLLLGIQILQRIQTLHEQYMLHRDIKPDNFLFGLGEHNNKLYLVDLGFCKRYSYNGHHMAEKTVNSIIGSANFVSVNVHRGIEPSRRDDLESAMYIILNMLVGPLEWFGETDTTTIFELKLKLSHNLELPTFFQTMLQYVRSLEFQETPNYKFLIGLLQSVFVKYKFEDTDLFEWTN